MKRRLCGIAAVLLILLLSACGRNSSENAVAPTESRSVSPSPAEEKGEPGEETGDMELKLKIGDTEVSVRWEDNGSNSWAYTRLGKITDRTASEMKDLLGNGDTTLTLYTE